MYHQRAKPPTHHPSVSSSLAARHHSQAFALSITTLSDGLTLLLPVTGCLLRAREASQPPSGSDLFGSRWRMFQRSHTSLISAKVWRNLNDGMLSQVSSGLAFCKGHCEYFGCGNWMARVVKYRASCTSAAPSDEGTYDSHLYEIWYVCSVAEKYGFDY